METLGEELDTRDSLFSESDERDEGGGRKEASGEPYWDEEGEGEDSMAVDDEELSLKDKLLRGDEWLLSDCIDVTEGLLERNPAKSPHLRLLGLNKKPSPVGPCGLLTPRNRFTAERWKCFSMLPQLAERDI